MRAAGEAPDARQQLGAVEEQVGDIEGAGVGAVEEQEGGGGHVRAVDLGGDARLDDFAAQVGGEEALPLVRAAAVDPGRTQRDAAAGERLFARQLTSP